MQTSQDVSADVTKGCSAIRFVKRQEKTLSVTSVHNHYRDSVIISMHAAFSATMTIIILLLVSTDTLRAHTTTYFLVALIYHSRVLLWLVCNYSLYLLRQVEGRLSYSIFPCFVGLCMVSFQTQISKKRKNILKRKNNNRLTLW